MIGYFDLIRSKILKETMKVSFFRALFLNRHLRILFLSLLAIAFYFTASLFFPLWVLLIGPVLWGIPHLISSIRYNTYMPEHVDLRKKLLLLQAAIWCCVFLYRIAVDLFDLNLFLSAYPLLFEGLCLILAFSFQIYVQKKITPHFLLFGLAFTTLIGCTYFYPIATALVLLIGHNYIPLYTWFKSCQQRQDLIVFFIISFIYIALSVGIYFGVFDFIYSYLAPQGHIGFLNWSYSDIVSSFRADPSEYKFWFHIVCLYAFSQAMHYFMWLKAIPENYQKQQAPPSFKFSYNRLTTEFGSTSVYFMAATILFGLLYWLLFEFQTARLIYFSIASYHGFMELSALPFLKSNRKPQS